MSEEIRPRFRSPQAALRFYFRASELITDNARPGIISKTRPFNPTDPPNIICDFIRLDSCFQDMDDEEVWLLQELYGPTFFGVPPRTVTRACEAARHKFPAKRWSRNLVSRFRQRALKVIEGRLRRVRMI